MRPWSELREIALTTLDYDPYTGEFTSKVRRGRMMPGTRAGGLHSTTGYVTIRVAGHDVGAHRLAWMMTYGDPGDTRIDHINGIRDDNRIVNLRLATGSQNQMNLTVEGRRKGRLIGAHRSVHTTKFKAVIKVDGKQLHLGYFSTEHEAHEAYLAGRYRYFGEFAPLRQTN